MAAAKKEKFVANWRLEGIGKEPIEAGKVVELTADDATEFVACGVLSPVDGGDVE